MVWLGLSGASVLSVAAGVYTLVNRRLPPVFPDGRGGRSAPEVPGPMILLWGLAFIFFGILLTTIVWVVDAYTRGP